MTLMRPLCPHGHELGCMPPDNCQECMEEQDRVANEVVDKVLSDEKRSGAFIRVLHSVGGVNPCLHNKDGKNLFWEGEERAKCPSCHGTGSILDLAPLLANPVGLSNVVHSLLVVSGDSDASGESGHDSIDDETYVVGPQRASNLVYEVARQLGGTAVVAITEWKQQHRMFASEYIIGGYRLSLPIPPDATVLFVTDRVIIEEMLEIGKCVDGKQQVLPYILCLISGGDTFEFVAGNKKFKVISLHQEKQ